MSEDTTRNSSTPSCANARASLVSLVLLRTDALEGEDPLILKCNLPFERESSRQENLTSEERSFTHALDLHLPGLALAALALASTLTGLKQGARAARLKPHANSTHTYNAGIVCPPGQNAMICILVNGNNVSLDVVAGLARFVGNAVTSACGQMSTWKDKLTEIRPALDAALRYADSALFDEKKADEGQCTRALALFAGSVPCAPCSERESNDASNHLRLLCTALDDELGNQVSPSEVALYRNGAVVASTGSAAFTVGCYGLCVARGLVVPDASSGASEREGAQMARLGDTTRAVCYVCRGGDVLCAAVDANECAQDGALASSLSLAWATLGAVREYMSLPSASQLSTTPRASIDPPPARAWRCSRTGTFHLHASSDMYRKTMHDVYVNTLRPLLLRCQRRFDETRSMPSHRDVIVSLAARQRRLQLPGASPLAVLNAMLAEDVGVSPKVPGTRGAMIDGVRRHLADGLSDVWRARPEGTSKLATARMVTAVLGEGAGRSSLRAVARIDTDGTEFYLLLVERGDGSVDWEAEIAALMTQMRMDMAPSEVPL